MRNNAIPKASATSNCMSRWRFIVVAIASAILLSGCVSILESALGARFTDQPQSEYNDPKYSLVFMHFDFKDKPVNLAYVSIDKSGVNLKDGEPPSLSTDTATRAAMPGTMIGPFFNEKGSYQVSSFTGSTNNTNYHMEDYVKNATTFTIQEPGIYFLGSYIYKESGRKSFTLDKTASPSERELLQKMLNLEWVRGSLWETRIKQRIAQLTRIKQRIAQLN